MPIKNYKFFVYYRLYTQIKLTKWVQISKMKLLVSFYTHRTPETETNFRKQYGPLYLFTHITSAICSWCGAFIYSVTLLGRGDIGEMLWREGFSKMYRHLKKKLVSDILPNSERRIFITQVHTFHRTYFNWIYSLQRTFQGYSTVYEHFFLI